MAKCIWILAEIALDNLKSQTFLWLDILLCQNNEIKQEKVGTITNAADPNNQSYFLLKKQTSIKNKIVKVYFFFTSQTSSNAYKRQNDIWSWAANLNL